MPDTEIVLDSYMDPMNQLLAFLEENSINHKRAIYVDMRKADDMVVHISTEPHNNTEEELELTDDEEKMLDGEQIRSMHIEEIRDPEKD